LGLSHGTALQNDLAPLLTLTVPGNTAKLVGSAQKDCGVLLRKNGRYPGARGRLMIVDVHYHYMRLPADETAARMMTSRLLLDADRAGVTRTVEDILPAYRDLMDDSECDKLVARMGESGVDVTIICVVDNVDYGLDNERIMRVNQYCATAARKHPGRLLSLAGIDPRRPDAPALFRTCIDEFGMNGLKWHPDDGYYPNSLEAYSVLEIANARKVPLLTHCSPLVQSRAKYALPIHLDDVALDFPNVEIIAAHMGNMWWRDWTALAQYKRNMSGDLAMWQLTCMSKPALFRRYLREILDILGPGQVLFASDGPVFEPIVSNRDWVQAIKDLTIPGSDGIVFTPEEVEAILGGNAARIFGLKE